MKQQHTHTHKKRLYFVK